MAKSLACWLCAWSAIHAISVFLDSRTKFDAVCVVACVWVSQRCSVCCLCMLVCLGVLADVLVPFVCICISMCHCAIECVSQATSTLQLIVNTVFCFRCARWQWGAPFTLCRAPSTLYRGPSHYTEILHKMQSPFIIYKAPFTLYRAPSHYTELPHTIQSSFTLCRAPSHYTELLHNIQSPSHCTKPLRGWCRMVQDQTAIH